MKVSQPYQPFLLRVLHGLNGLFVLGAILTAFWTYNTYDGRWGTVPLPRFSEIEGIHGTFGLWALLLFPAFALYAFHRGQNRLVQPDSLSQLAKLPRSIGRYALHRTINTVMIVALTFSLFSGKMMDEKWLPRGELHHFWYSAHLLGWVILVVCLLLHLLTSAMAGGAPLLRSMLSWRYRSADSPALWKGHVQAWWQQSWLNRWLTQRKR